MPTYATLVSMRFVTLPLLLLACGASDPLDTADSAVVDSDCSDAQLVTYNSFGKSFLTHSCQGCHASTAPDRYGAPEDVTFDDLESVWERSSIILAVAVGDEPTMPPQGGVNDMERTKLRWWLQCGEEGL
jgi:cytochrome c5